MPEPAFVPIRTISSINIAADTLLNRKQPAWRQAADSDSSELPPGVCMTRPSAPVLLSDLNIQENGEGGDMKNPDPVMLYLEHFF